MRIPVNTTPGMITPLLFTAGTLQQALQQYITETTFMITDANDVGCKITICSVQVVPHDGKFSVIAFVKEGRKRKPVPLPSTNDVFGINDPDPCNIHYFVPWGVDREKCVNCAAERKAVSESDMDVDKTQS